MLKEIIIHELQSFIYSLRFHIAFVLVLVMYGISTFSYILEYKEIKANYEDLSKKKTEEIRELAGESATQLAINRSQQLLLQRNSSFISSCNEQSIPNTITYSAYNVFGYGISKGKSNPFLMQSGNMSVNWQFIIIMLFSFLAIVFSYDAISGEKETKTLALCLSNSLPRGKVLLGKYISITLILFLFALIGSVLSVFILLAASIVSFSAIMLFEIFSFLLLVLLLVLCLTAMGIFTSVLCHNSNVSLLIALTIWLFIMFVVPNTALQLSDTLFPYDNEATVAEQTREERDEIEARYPDGKWSSRGGMLDYPPHEIRANMQSDFLENEKKYYHDWYNQQFSQYEKTRKLTYLSPIAVFECGTEALLDGGYFRFQKNWQDLHNYQTQFLAFFKEFDSKDPESPHWYNPYERYSTTAKPVTFDEVPKYTERIKRIGERISQMSICIGLLIVYTGLFFVLAFARFIKYDVR